VPGRYTMLKRIPASPVTPRCKPCTGYPVSQLCQVKAKARACSPEAKRKDVFTPPPGPRANRRELESDIKDALAAESQPLLCLALVRSHWQCSEDHSLHEAVSRKNLAAVVLLLRHGATVNSRCRSLRPLHLALECCRQEGDVGYAMADLLLQSGADPNMLPGDLSTADPPLHFACRQHNVAAVRMLLKGGASPDCRSSTGQTALHVLCNKDPQPAFPRLLQKAKRRSVLQELLQARASPILKDDAGRTPAELARGEEDLHRIIVHAERGWYCCALSASCNHSPGPFGPCVPWSLREVFDEIVGFL